MRTVVLLLLWSCGAADENDVSCKDENNNIVTWYVVYKAPWTKDKDKSYIYMSDTGVQTAKDTLISGVLANTLSPMFRNNKPNTFGFLKYNDQPPKGSAKSGCGHSKGVVMGDSQSKKALWLVHSIPKFPSEDNKDTFWGGNGDVNGQSFMCVSLTYDDLEKVEKHLKHIKSHVMNPTDFLKGAHEWENPEDNYQGTLQDLTKIKDVQFKIMAKKNDENKQAAAGDLYVQLAQAFNSDMYAQTWPKSGTDEDFDNGVVKVFNIEEVHTEVGNWKRGNDHSKWAVTTTNGVHWTCIGDSNKAESQYNRPGGALCLDDAQVHQHFSDFRKNKAKRAGGATGGGPASKLKS